MLSGFRGPWVQVFVLPCPIARLNNNNNNERLDSLEMKAVSFYQVKHLPAGRLAEDTGMKH